MIYVYANWTSRNEITVSERENIMDGIKRLNIGEKISEFKDMTIEII